MAKKTKKEYIELMDEKNELTMRIYATDNDDMPYYGTLNINDAFAIRFNVVDGEKGLFISWPSYKNKKGEYVNTAYCFDKKIAKAISKLLDNCVEQF